MAELLLKLSENLYLKDPQGTSLGKKIISKSILLIDKLGFEAFTFKKLSIEIDSTEASIYRYFENKHRLLLYLIAWYWNWIEYQISFENHNISDPLLKLKTAIQIICSEKTYDPLFPDIDKEALQRIVIGESDKTYLIKDVDAINSEGLFKGHKKLCSKIAALILDVSPNYSFSNSLASTILEISNQQPYFSRHLPSLTDIKDVKQAHSETQKFIEELVFKALKP